MLKRVHVKGYKSLVDVEVELEPLVVLFGPNASGKSNFLDALRLLSMVGTSRTLRDAFDPPYRGTPLESFHVGRNGIEGLSAQERLAFSIEADLRLSASTLTAVDRQVRDMRGSARRPASRSADRQREAVHAHNLRYRIEIEMLPRSGALRVADEYLAPLTTRGEPSRRRPFLERQGDKLLMRREGGTHVTHHDRYLDHSILSMPHYPPHHPISSRRGTSSRAGGSSASSRGNECGGPSDEPRGPHGPAGPQGARRPAPLHRAMRLGASHLLDVSCQHAVGWTPHFQGGHLRGDRHVRNRRRVSRRQVPAELPPSWRLRRTRPFTYCSQQDVADDSVRVVTSYRPGPNDGEPDMEDRETETMKCRVCGAPLRSITTDLPLKVSDHRIVIVKKLPIQQCDGCIEYLIEDSVMARVDELLGRVDRSTELEVVPFAA